VPLIHLCDYYYIHLTAFFQDKLGKPAPERQNHSRFYWSKRWCHHDGVAVASAGPYANHLHLTPYR